MEFTIKDCWQLTEILFNTLQNLSVCKGVGLNNNLIFKFQQFVPKGANINCLVFSKNCSGIDMQIRIGDDKKLKDIIVVVYTSFAVTAYTKVKVVISY